MSKIDKLITKILNGKSIISTDEAIKLLTYFGYNPKIQKSGTSHMLYKKDTKAIVIILDRKELLHWQVKELQTILKEEGY